VKAPKLESLLAPEVVSALSRVDAHITNSIASDVPLLFEISNYLNQLGGKRIRPALTILCSRLLGHKEVTEELLNICAGIELIHMATLLHDDIIDKAPTRRGKESAYKKFGETNTLIAGNFLFVKAFGLCAKLDKYIIEETEKACVDLTEGEILEDISNFSIEDSLAICGKKTGALFRLAALSGGFVACRDTTIANKLSVFGQSLGIAFQISDDILDITSTIEQLGKSPCTDLREQKPSIVNCLWLKSGSELASSILNMTVSPSEDLVQRAVSEIKVNGIIEEARSLGNDYVKSAHQVILSLENDFYIKDQETKKLVLSIIDFAASRLN